MIAGRLAGLSLLMLTLAALIAFEATDQYGVPADRTSRQTTPAFARTKAQATVPRTDVEGRLGEILARPVFSADRRPAAAGAKIVAGLSRLTGIVVMGSHRVAIFAGAPGERSVVAEAGARVNAYEVTEITDSGVTVVGPTGRMVMTPVFDATQQQAPKRGSMVLPVVSGSRKQ